MAADCPLLHATGCGWCGCTLKGRQTRWCSRKCSRAYTANHRWTQARAAAKAEATWYLCANSRVDDSIDLIESPPDCLAFTRKPEVNHVTPIKGKHGSWGCHHHQDGLEVLCRPCHLKATAQQRKEGLL